MSEYSGSDLRGQVRPAKFKLFDSNGLISLVHRYAGEVDHIFLGLQCGGLKFAWSRGRFIESIRRLLFDTPHRQEAWISMRKTECWAHFPSHRCLKLDFIIEDDTPLAIMLKEIRGTASVEAHIEAWATPCYYVEGMEDKDGVLSDPFFPRVVTAIPDCFPPTHMCLVSAARDAVEARKLHLKRLKWRADMGGINDVMIQIQRIREAGSA